MKRTVECKFIVLLLFVFSLSVFGQSNESIEQELVAHLKNIGKWSNYGSSYNEDLLYRENEIFKQKLLKYTRRLSTLKYKFTRLDEHLFISTSEDGKFRIYSWDTETGGTMHFYNRVYQYLGTNGRVYSKTDNLDAGDPGGFVYEIFTLDTKSGRIYLACSNSILSTSQAAQSVNLFKVENNSLNDRIRLIKTRTGVKNWLGFEYDFFSVVDRKERPLKLILYDKATDSIKIPVVLEDETYQYGKVTNKFIVYKFDGKYFVRAS